MIGKIFIVDLSENSILETFFLTFDFWRQVIKKRNSKLSIWVILDLWSIKVRKIDKMALNKSTQKY